MAQKSQYKRYTRSRAGNIFYFGFLILAGAFSILPLIYCISTSFKPLDELLIFPPRFFVHRPTINNYTIIPVLLEKLRVPFSRYLFNSIFVTLVTVVFQILVSSLAAFALAKAKIKGIKIYFIIVQFSLLYNATTLAIPQYIIISNLKLIDTLAVYIVPALASSMGVFLMKQYIDSGVPDTLLEAARIDGASAYKMYWSIIMPLIKPAWMTMLLLSFQSMWSATASSGTIFSEELKTLPSVLSSIAAGGTARAGAGMAISVIMMIPPIIVYFITQSNVMETMSNAGMKG